MGRRRRMKRNWLLLTVGFWGLVLGLVAFVVVRYWYYVLAGLGVLTLVALGLLVLKIHLEGRKERVRLEQEEQEIRARRRAQQVEQHRQAEVREKQEIVLVELRKQVNRFQRRLAKLSARAHSFEDLHALEKQVQDLHAEVGVRTTRPPFASALGPQVSAQVNTLAATLTEGSERLEKLREELREGLGRVHLYVTEYFSPEATLEDMYRIYFDTGLLQKVEAKKQKGVHVVDVYVNKQRYLREYGAEFLDSLLLSVHLWCFRHFSEVVTVSQVNAWVEYVDESTGRDGVKCAATSRALREFITKIKPAKVNPRKALEKCETNRLSKFEILAPEATAVVPARTLRKTVRKLNL